MKLILMFLSITLMNNGCSSNFIQKNISIEYTTSTRGYYFQVIIKKETIAINKQRGSNPEIKTFPKDRWGNIIEELKKIDVENLENFQVPSKEHQSDGAKIAFLKITENNKMYQTQKFDHGNPPKEIAAIVKEILSITENIE